MKEKLQEYALVAEIVGAVAIIVSLIYVGISVEQNTDAIRVANHQSLVAMDMEKNAWLRDKEFNAIYVAARENPDNLSAEQRQQYNTFIADTLNAWEFAFITYRNGAIEDMIWNGWDGFYRSELKTAAFRAFWENQRPNFSPDFGAYLDSILATN